MRTLILAIMLTSLPVHAANIYVVEQGGLLSGYRPQLGNKLMEETCFSVTSDNRRLRQTDSNNREHRAFYQYKQASLCRGGSGRLQAPGATLVRTDLVGALGRPGFPDAPVPVTTDSHHSVVADVIKSNTTSGVKQWHVMQQFLLGVDGLGNAAFVNYNALTQGSSTSNLVRALEHIANGFFSLNGVKVINISSHEENRFEWPCDNNPEVRSSASRVDLMDAISRLRNRGVTTVVATANSSRYPNQPGNRLQDNYKMPFPACLSTTVSVGGLSNQGFAQGAIAPGTDFLANFHHPHPLNGSDQTGTSFATPKVASNLVQLLTINPVLNNNQALTALRNTANFHSGSRTYNNGAFRINYRIAVPNFAAARSSIVDNFWKDLIPLLLGDVDDTRYGWNYGSDIHENGVLSYFETVNVPQQQVIRRSGGVDGLTVVSQAQSVGQPTLRFSFRPYDIDTSDELQILVNDKFYGHAKRTGSNQLGATQSVCIASADLKSDGSDNEVKLRLKNSRETWGVTNLKVEIGTVDNACLTAPPSFPDLPANGDRLAGTSEPSGNAYQRLKVNNVPFSFNFTGSNGGLPTSSTYNTNGIHRDIRVKFTTKSGDTAANSTLLRVNGAQVLQTPSFSGSGERSYEYIVNRNMLNGGSNTIEFRPGVINANSVWGVRGISIEYINPVTLGIGSTNATRYGYNQTPTRYTGARANFSLGSVQNDYSFSVRGWGIDRADETRVFINGVSLGFLSVGTSGGLSQTDTFVMNRGRLRAGVNQIEFVQRRPGSGWQGATLEQWGIENMKVSVLRPDITPATPRIVEPKIEADTPFSLSTVISNIGAGSSSATTLNYYTSVDATITPGDTFMESRAVGRLSPGASISLVNQVQSPLVNQGYFIGVCLVAVANEVTAGNNCSKGIQMRSKPVIAPTIMLILDEE